MYYDGVSKYYAIRFYYKPNSLYAMNVKHLKNNVRFTFFIMKS